MANSRTQPPLTARQREIYELIRDRIVNRGYGPTVREIGAEFGILSPNGVMCHLKALEKKGMITREPGLSRAIQLSEKPQHRTSLPMAGQIAAGRPVLAVAQAERIDFSPLFGDDHFCLQVEGDALHDEGLADGDYVIFRRQPDCRDGEMVVCVPEGEDATVKRCFREPKRTRLEGVGGKRKSTFSKNVEILGVVRGVVRRSR